VGVKQGAVQIALGVGKTELKEEAQGVYRERGKFFFLTFLTTTGEKGTKQEGKRGETLILVIISQGGGNCEKQGKKPKKSIWERTPKTTTTGKGKKNKRKTRQKNCDAAGEGTGGKKKGIQKEQHKREKPPARPPGNHSVPKKKNSSSTFDDREKTGAKGKCIYPNRKNEKKSQFR